MADIGIGQSVICNQNGNDPDFYNTAWTLQIIRGLLLFVAGIAAALPVAKIYQTQELVVILPVVAIGFVLTGCTVDQRPSSAEKASRLPNSITLMLCLHSSRPSYNWQ